MSDGNVTDRDYYKSDVCGVAQDYEPSTMQMKRAREASEAASREQEKTSVFGGWFGQKKDDQPSTPDKSDHPKDSGKKTTGKGWRQSLSNLFSSKKTPGEARGERMRVEATSNMAHGTPNTVTRAKTIRRKLHANDPEYTALAEDSLGMNSQDAYKAFEAMADDTPTKTPEEERS